MRKRRGGGKRTEEKERMGRGVMKFSVILMVLGLLSILSLVGGVLFIILTVLYLGTSVLGIIASKKQKFLWLFAYEAGLVIIFLLNISLLTLILYLFIVSYLILNKYSTDLPIGLVYTVFFLVTGSLVLSSVLVYHSFKHVRAFIKFLKTPEPQDLALIDT